MITFSTPCSAVTPKHTTDARERHQLCCLAQPSPGQTAKGTAGFQGARSGGGKSRGISCHGVTGFPSTAQALTHWRETGGGDPHGWGVGQASRG